MTMPLRIQISPIVTETPTESNTIQMPKRIFALLKCQETMNITCHKLTNNTEIVRIEEKDLNLYFSTQLLNKLNLPTIPFTASIKHIHQSNELEIGPFIAILTEIKKNDDQFTFGSLQLYCEEIALYCHKVGVLFYTLSPKTFRKQQIKGLIYNNLDNNWVESPVPLPHVVHNRIHSRKSEQSTLFSSVKEALYELNIPFFNDRYINKWDAYNILSNEDYLQPYLPETLLLHNKQDIQDLTTKFDTVFIKPIHGSQGKRIFQIKRKDHEFILDYTTFTAEIEHKYDSFVTLFKSLRPRLIKEAYVGQQGLNLITVDNRPVDFRILCHCRNHTEWTITSAVARVSAVGQFVSNIYQGGEFIRVADCLQQSFDQTTAKHIHKLLKELAIEIASVISKATDGLYGELGIDLAVDNMGHPWIIEINTKPSKNHDPKRKQDTIRPSAKAIVNHCLNLANFFNEGVN
ncbi:YheC/YheD family protein [Cytobacillus sp. IB215316]|uniref:YheC/YheD family endospore coat-associated protein n=1 Tax=Cytobacillus sp. IB215316 TaxID=3097354 RepID=UPI002A0F4E88|nr:YheC/YheD family protein [Cytobacillus sp. IB215316]MDX8363343.1 YheC/YheD family protein [Cytobacillus sp. IB215316]